MLLEQSYSRHIYDLPMMQAACPPYTASQLVSHLPSVCFVYWVQTWLLVQSSEQLCNRHSVGPRADDTLMHWHLAHLVGCRGFKTHNANTHQEANTQISGLIPITLHGIAFNIRMVTRAYISTNAVSPCIVRSEIPELIQTSSSPQHGPRV